MWALWTSRFDMGELKKGFEPFIGYAPKVLILGSFPSVKSRKIEFYYGNPQNRFWKTLAEFFGQPLPQAVKDKKEFLSLNQIALWDVVSECEIVGSQDFEIKNFKVADVQNLLQKIDVKLIILNGSKAFEIFARHCGDIQVPYIQLPSTSPANTHFSKEKWFDTLSGVFVRN